MIVLLVSLLIAVKITNVLWCSDLILLNLTLNKLLWRIQQFRGREGRHSNPDCRLTLLVTLV